MVKRTLAWLCWFGGAACICQPAWLPAQPVAPPQVSSPGTLMLFPVAIVFEPALPAVGELAVSHESGWSFAGSAAPSGVTLAMPEGPANLTLQVGAKRYHHSIKVGGNTLAESAANSGGAQVCVWQLD